MSKFGFMFAFLAFSVFAQAKQDYNGNLGIHPEAFQVALNAALAKEGASFRANRGKPVSCPPLTCFLMPFTDSLIMNTMHNNHDGSVRVIMIVLSKSAPDIDARVKLPQLMRAIVKTVTPMVPGHERENVVVKLTRDAVRSKDNTARFSKDGVRYILAGVPDVGLIFTVQREDN